MLEFAAKANPKPPAILFSGGEPLEREDMPEIIAAAHRLKVYDYSGNQWHPFS